MDVKEAIQNRKSIRKYLQKDISDEIITKLIDAARLAPSARNTQAHKYYIITDNAKKEKLRQENVFQQDYIYNAPLLIICCSNPSEYTNPEHNYPLIDVSIASSFMVLRAQELNLGSVFIGLVDREKIKKLLNIPNEFIVPFVLALGYPDENPVKKPKKEIKEILF